MLDRASLASGEQTDVGAMTSMLLADIAVETMAKAAVQHLGLKVSSNPNIYDLRKALEDARPGLAGRNEMAAAAKLRQARNPVQHSAMVPSHSSARMWVDEAEAFARLIARDVWGVDFATISVVSLVRDPVLSEKLHEALDAFQANDLGTAIIKVAGTFETMRIRWKRKTRSAFGVDLGEKEAFLPALFSPAAAAVVGDHDAALYTEPKLAEDKYGPVAELTMGFSLEELLSLRAAVDVVDALARRRDGEEPLEIHAEPEQVQHLIEVVARQLWRLETTQPTLFGRAADWPEKKTDTAASSA